MSNNGVRFRCPVCHARQPLQDECRRCQADLSLVVRARRRIGYLLRQRSLLERDFDPARRERIAKELSFLSPEHSARREQG